MSGTRRGLAGRGRTRGLRRRGCGGGTGARLGSRDGARLACPQTRVRWRADTLVVYAHGRSHAHHWASLGLWWLAVLVAEGPDINGMFWAVREDWNMVLSPLMVAVWVRRPVGCGADGRLEWVYALGEAEVARAVRVAVAMGADVNRQLYRAWPLMSCCTARGCLEAVKACLAAGAEVDAQGGYITDGWWTALVHAGFGVTRR